MPETEPSDWVTAPCSADELREKEAIGFEVDGQGVFLIVNDDGEVRAYRNNCPHLNIELNWQPDGFLDWDRQFIQCKTHGALFRKDDGYCIVGPCNGDFLSALTARIDNGRILVERPD